MLDAFYILERNALSLKLDSLSIRELFYLEESPCDVYILKNDLFIKFLPIGKTIDSALLKDLLKNNVIRVFVPKDERNKIIEKHQQLLIRLTRSLSMGESLDRVKKQINILTITLQHLYEDTTNDEILTTQFQGIKNLFQFLVNRPESHFEIYQELIKSKHHFVFCQPMISSLFLAGVMKSSHLFAFREMENFFIVSYFKDVGMSAIPYEKFGEPKLSKKERKSFLHHPKNSVNILNGRIPVSQNLLRIIACHHSLSFLRTEQLRAGENETESELEDQVLIGTETILVMALDMFAAMISERPYRKAVPIFTALDMLKNQIGNQYPKEFKLIVTYFKTFFSQGGEQKSA